MNDTPETAKPADATLVNSHVGTPETAARHERTKAATARSFLAAAASLATLGSVAAFAPPRHRNAVRVQYCAICSEPMEQGGRSMTPAGAVHSRCLPAVEVKATKSARISDEFLP